VACFDGSRLGHGAADPATPELDAARRSSGDARSSAPCVGGDCLMQPGVSGVERRHDRE